MASEGNSILFVHWNDSIIPKHNEIEYSIPPIKVLFISEGDDFNTVYQTVLEHVRGGGFSEIHAIYGKMPKYQNSVYVGSKVWPIHDDRPWSHFFRIALNEYEELQIFVDAINNSIAMPQNLVFDDVPTNAPTTFHNFGQVHHQHMAAGATLKHLRTSSPLLCVNVSEKDY
ncbi:unnamed protein product [Cuscuta epithymum]|uniref:Uncharacterized protein n=1 Tax=Cuscuta epithymum TaxID=186058 RepID=A0AAV0FEU0_9ASTE|nr:unnamed protein product [Cuscuta epithymum]